MDGAEVLIPITLFVSTAATLFGIVYMHKRESLAMIEKGMNPREGKNRPAPPAPYKSLKWGLLLVGAGAGLLLAYILSEYVLVHQDKFGNYYSRNNEAIYFALIAMGGGLGLIASYRVEKKEVLDKYTDNNNS